MKKRNLLEELKRHRQLLEYNFYVQEKKDDEYNGDLLLDDMFLTEQDPVPGEEEEDFFADLDVTADEEPTDEEPTGEEVPAEEEPIEDVMGMEGDVEIEDEFAEEPMDMSSDEDTIEVDVTDIVDKTEETKDSVDSVNTKMDELLQKLGDLESQVTGMDNIIDKIEGLEKEIERRNPTPVERLEMRSMDSYPYSVKLTDFWKDQEGYEVNGEKEDEEYVLKQSDIDEFNDDEIKDSFNS